MSYRMPRTGGVGPTFASVFANAGIKVAFANSRGANAVEPVVE